MFNRYVVQDEVFECEQCGRKVTEKSSRCYDIHCALYDPRFESDDYDEEEDDQYE